MKAQILSNLSLAFLWMAFTGNWSGSGFIIGYLIGAAFVMLLRPFWSAPLYLSRVWAVLRLIGIFIKELIVSSFAVIRYILTPRLAIQPGIFAYHTELKSDWEVTLLSCLICLTPGTLTLEVSEDGDTLYIHAMNIEDVSLHAEQIRNSFEKAIKEVTR
ncbi:Na+/H+ antiporter subunit E [Paenibacillus antibioticophila]|uniref:Na(+)/H(+) antiporter subunit E n=1 Tax=Paenibacillus antibioticophila TaxID=1274374 RepID=A0A919XVD6_9BACL|nr:Na+/H+ antiporter subunit E [Paenibacillus antibioticophila]GIO37143.1 Na(+)/H(+) antiporter subunit E [Paenibacillus antibioticophila]